MKMDFNKKFEQVLEDILECKILEIYGINNNELQLQLKHQYYTYSKNIYDFILNDGFDWAIKGGYELRIGYNAVEVYKVLDKYSFTKVNEFSSDECLYIICLEAFRWIYNAKN